jgi:hypothetical protein
MTDLVFVAIVLAFMALCVAYIAWCDRIIGPDESVATVEPASSVGADVVAAAS